MDAVQCNVGFQFTINLELYVILPDVMIIKYNPGGSLKRILTVCCGDLKSLKRTRLPLISYTSIPWISDLELSMVTISEAGFG